MISIVPSTYNNQRSGSGHECDWRIPSSPTHLQIQDNVSVFVPDNEMKTEYLLIGRDHLELLPWTEG